jgi:hypothetical protein
MSISALMVEKCARSRNEMATDGSPAKPVTVAPSDETLTISTFPNSIIVSVLHNAQAGQTAQYSPPPVLAISTSGRPNTQMPHSSTCIAPPIKPDTL